MTPIATEIPAAIRGVDQKPVTNQATWTTPPSEVETQDHTSWMLIHQNSPRTSIEVFRHADEHPFGAVMTIHTINQDVKELEEVKRPVSHGTQETGGSTIEVIDQVVGWRILQVGKSLKI